MFSVRLSLLLLQGFLAAAQSTASIAIQSTGNPILADGSFYSADPAPLVVNDTLYIISGHDQAPLNVNEFVQNDWEMFVSSSPPSPAGSNWTLHPGIARPETVFKWASPGTAYASQVVQGPDGRFYLYAPVTQAGSTNSDPFAIGVAVSDSPLGPFTDAHPSGPIISQSVPAPGDNIENIDPTVLVDDDGKVYLYEGTFGALRGYELASDMVTIISSATVVTSLTGYFEAPWLMKRGATYYMLFAANNAGPTSPCTPTSYHACIAYGTASSPLGPWKFQGVILGIVSSTTSHSGAVEMNGQWYLFYHNADAVNGGHFRRSIAFDVLNWDDTQTPPRILPIVQTHRPEPPAPPTRNIALKALASSVNPTPIQYWTVSINDGKIPENPLPPDYWSSWNADLSPQTNQIILTWNTTVTLDATRMAFFADHPAGANVGVPPPTSWKVEFLNTNGAWVAVANTTAYPLVVTDDPAVVPFAQISTKSLRATLIASGGSGGVFGGVGVKEWEAWAPTAQ